MNSVEFSQRKFLLRVAAFAAVLAGALLAPRGAQSLAAAADGCGVPVVPHDSACAPGGKIKVRKTRAMSAPKPGDAAWMNAFYTRGTGGDMASYMSIQRKSDVQDDFRRRFSTDNGRTWSDWEAVTDYKAETPQGTLRRYPQPGWVDPGNGRLLTMVMEGVLPRDNPMEGMTRWSLHYRVSTDGGRTFVVDEPVIQKGDYTAEHPAEGVWIGKNSMMIGATTCRPIRTCRGEILVPVQITPLGPDGKYHRPGGGFTYHDAAVLIGRWSDGMKIEWELSERVVADPTKSTRGCLEPTIAEMPDGRILMVCRGSNDVKPKLPGYKWFSVSRDGGRTWSNPPRPWTYADGTNFFSPSSCSQLLRHSNGKYYWLGNISPDNPRGNLPRRPLVIGEVDPESLLLVKETVAMIDTKGPGDDDSLQLSNFLAYEDRFSGEIVLHLTRLLTDPPPWRGDAYVYRIGVEQR
jgi:hypothetical protein